jgi:hypothetical protein
MDKSKNKLYRKYYKKLKHEMGIFWFSTSKKNKPIDSYGFWVDAFASDDRMFVPHKIPYNYVIDIFCDIVARSKVSAEKDWKTIHPLNYYNNFNLHIFPLEQSSELLLKTLLKVMSESINEKDFINWYKSMSKLIKVIY